ALPAPPRHGPKTPAGLIGTCRARRARIRAPLPGVGRRAPPSSRLDRTSVSPAKLCRGCDDFGEIQRHPGEEVGVRPRRKNVRVTSRIYALANQKGGVGKTTTAVNLAACLAEAGERALVIDLDPQANATSGLGERANGVSSYDLLDGVPLHELAKPTRFPNLD